MSFSSPDVCRGLDYCGCDSGMVVTELDGQEVLLLSHPADPADRKRLGISVSRDGGVSWQYLRTISDAPCQYSDIVGFADGSLGVLYGSGGVGKQQTMFAHFSPEWLREGTR